jgi:hypothetical protein
MELSPSRDAASCSTTQELPSILYNQINYNVHKSPQLFPILSYFNLEHTIPSYLSNIQYIIIIIIRETDHTSTFRNEAWECVELLHHNPVGVESTGFW